MKSIFHICFVFLLSASILAPAVVNLVADDFAIEFTTNKGEEEQKKEGKKEIEEKEFFYPDEDLSLLIFSKELKIHSFSYSDSFSASEIEILIPPPKYIL